MQSSGEDALKSAAGSPQDANGQSHPAFVGAIAGCFLAVLAIGPICFGAVEPWSLLTLQLSNVMVALLWIASNRHSTSMQLDLPSVVLLAFGLCVVLQLVTGITVYRYATYQELLKIGVYFLSFSLARRLLMGRIARRHAATFFALFGGLMALFAIVQKLHANSRIYWLRESSTQAFFGPYANKNHYAGLIEMLVPFAIFCATSSRLAAAQRVLLGFAAAVMIVSVLLSGSRSGTLVILFELIVFAGFMLMKDRRNPRVVAAALLVFVIGMVLWIASDSILEQMTALRGAMSDPSALNRSQVTRDSWQLVKQRPLFGWGLGTFPVVYPQVASWYTDLQVSAAHDDGLQLLVETGATGTALMLAFVAGVLRLAARRLSSRTVAAALLGCCGFLLHSFTDFNLHVPANAAIFFALCGMICGAHQNESSRQHDPFC